MGRFLIYFSYIGTHYSSFFRNVLPENKPDFRSVVGVLEGLCRYVTTEKSNPVLVVPSTETITGSHAFLNTCHADIVTKTHLEPFNMINSMQQMLNRGNHEITVRDIRVVPDNFDARSNIKKRTYLYRLATLNRFPINETSTLPIIEMDRAHLLKSVVSCEQLEDAAVNLSSERASVFVTKALTCLEPHHEPLYKKLDFWDIVLTTKSSNCNEVMHMLNVIVAVAANKISLTKGRKLLVDGCDSISGVQLVPGGLWLKDIQYVDQQINFDYRIRTKNVALES